MPVGAGKTGAETGSTCTVTLYTAVEMGVGWQKPKATLLLCGSFRAWFESEDRVKLEALFAYPDCRGDSLAEKVGHGRNLSSRYQPDLDTWPKSIAKPKQVVILSTTSKY